MTDLQQYVDDHVKAVQEAQRLVEEAEARDGGATAEDKQRIDAALAHAAELRGRRDQMAQLAEEQADVDKRTAIMDDVRGELLNSAAETPLKVAPEPDFRQMGVAALRGELGRVDIDLAGAQYVNERIKQGAERRDVIEELEKRALSVATDTAGGHTVPTSTASNVIDYLQDIGGVMRAGATMIMTASGEDLELPTIAAHHAPSSTLETAEAADIAATEDTFGSITLKAHKYTGGVDVSRELLNDSIADIETLIVRMITRSIGIKLETRFTNGTASSMPKGINHSPVAANTHTTAASNQVAAGDLHAVRFGLDAGYLAQKSACRWMMDPAVYSHILQITVGSGDARPLFQPSYVVGEPDQIMGSPVSYNTFMPGGIADNDQAIVFGHIGDGYVVRMVSSISIESSTHALFKKQQVAFIGSVRADGAIRDQRALRYLKIKA